MTVTFKGLDELIKVLDEKAKPSDVKRVVATNTMELERRMKNKAEFKKGYETGATKRSITSELRDGTLTGAVMPTTEYAPYLINGTRYMEAQDFLRPALYEQREKFIKDLIETIDD